MARTEWDYWAAWLDRLAVEAEEFLAYIWPTQRRIDRIPRIYSHLNL